MRFSTALFASSVASLFYVAIASASPVVWTGPTVTFAKEAFADPSLATSQDFLTENVILTRGDLRGIFNIAVESAFQGNGVSSPSPAGTEWAFGKAEDFASHTFMDWVTLSGKNPSSLVGQDLTLHLIEDDIHLDLQFTEWGAQSSAGGAFAYSRTSAPEPSTALLVLLGVAGMAARPRSRPRLSMRSPIRSTMR